MQKYRLLTFLVFLTFTIGVVSHKGRPPEAPLIQGIESDVSSCALVFPEASQCSYVEDFPPHLTVYQPNQKGQRELAGYAFYSKDLAPDIKGYSGPISLMVGIDPQGNIQKVHIINHNETFGYIDKLSTFIKQFIGLTSDDPLVLGQDIDGLTRATISSQGVTDTIKKSLALMSPVVNKEPVVIHSPRLTVKWIDIYILLFIFIWAIAGIITRIKIFRYWALLISLIYLGFMQASMLSIVQLINFGLGQGPSWVGAFSWFVLAGLTLLTLLILGNLYCGSICPFAGLQEFLHIFSKKIKIPVLKPSLTFSLNSRFIKYIVLLVAMAAGFFFGTSDVASVEAFVLFFSFNLTTLGWVFVSYMLVMACFHYRFWCKYFCPLGALNGLIARWSFCKIRTKEACPGCKECVASCPTQAIGLKNNNQIQVNKAECILCGNCLRACTKNDLIFTIKK